MGSFLSESKENNILLLFKVFILTEIAASASISGGIFAFSCIESKEILIQEVLIFELLKIYPNWHSKGLPQQKRQTNTQTINKNLTFFVIVFLFRLIRR
jgi:hypothetical protein